MKFLKYLSQSKIIKNVREAFSNTLTDCREDDKKISLVDAATSAIAMFQLKCPSLLQFDEAAQKDEIVKDNLKVLYEIENVPCDTQMRTILDDVNPKELRIAFTNVFGLLDRSKVLSQFYFYQNKLLLSIDGTGFFSSKKIHCDSCCVKKHKNESITYYHQAVAGVFVHPENKVVIPICPEPIIIQDGASKNDCERHATERLLRMFRKEHPHLKVITTGDGLTSNGPYIKTLKELNFSFILGAKPGDHVTLYAALDEAEKNGLLEKLEDIDTKNGLHYAYSWINKQPLNATHQDCMINFLQLVETNLKTNTSTTFSWVTDLDLQQKSVVIIAKGGRARWKIENETFNTLKNQGYHFEHNFGHGKKNLSVNFMTLMFLAFLIDQSLQLACPFFKKALEIASNNKKTLWQKMRSYFQCLLFRDWEHFYNALIFKIKGQYAIFDSC